MSEQGPELDDFEKDLINKRRDRLGLTYLVGGFISLMATIGLLKIDSGGDTMVMTIIMGAVTIGLLSTAFWLLVRKPTPQEQEDRVGKQLDNMIREPSRGKSPKDPS